MDEDYNMVYGIDKLAELLIERGIEFFVKDELSLAFKDGVGSWHECWMAGADENRVNALIVVTPEQLLSVPDLNSIITENAKLRETMAQMTHDHAEQGREIKALKAENAELRSLVRNMYTCMEHVEGFGVYYDCENCALNTTPACDFEGRMLALGIEVEE